MLNGVSAQSRKGCTVFRSAICAPAEMDRDGWPFISRICRYNATTWGLLSNWGPAHAWAKAAAKRRGGKFPR